MWRILLAALATVLVVAGCTQETGDRGGGRPAEVDGIPTSAGTHKRKLDVGTAGHREFLLHVPAKVADGEWRDGGPAGLPEPRRKVKAPDARTECASTGKGEQGVAVTFCKINGGTHEWPDKATPMLWDFFAAHPRST